MKVTELGRLVWAKTWRPGWGRETPPGALWHSLIAHVWDSGHAAGWLWDHLLAHRVRQVLAADLEGGDASARARVRWLAAAHDLGKATPPFAGLDGQRRAELVAAGLPVDLSVKGTLPHGWLSGRLVYDALCEQGWQEETAEYVALVLAGHHGVFPGVGWLGERLRPKRRGTGPWQQVQAEVLDAAVSGSGAAPYLERWRERVPSVPAQLVQAGVVTLADWLASNEDLFAYEGALPDGYLTTSAQRVERAGEVMGVRAAWTPDPRSPRTGAAALYRSRFGIGTARAVQEAAYDLACSVTGPGLFVIEAPMGEGKTEAALAAAEVLAARLGANGVFFGLPTQATANQMFGRILEWLKGQGADTTVALAHGKAARQQDYRALLHRAVGVDECGAGVVASQWITGRFRSLLAPVVVATVDQLLLAGLASRYVSVRMLGLAGKVVVLDEVHAYDAYMSGLLHGVLAWLGALGVPVVLLSATLPAGQRRELAQAYAGRPVDTDRGSMYPRLTWTGAPDATPGERETRVMPAGTGRGLPVTVSLLPEPTEATVPDRIEELLAGGGCLLVIRNTVARAQALATELRRRLGAEAVTLMHARFTVADRRRLETDLEHRFGRDGTRPATRHVVVATQVAEQSLDVSFDALVTDLCPMDLLFQRIGRMHRHPADDRPQRLQDAQVVVTGFEDRPQGPPVLPGGLRTVYGDHLLWRTAAVLSTRPVLHLPAAIPELVDDVYGPDPVGPDSWQEQMAVAAQESQEQRQRMQEQALRVALKHPSAVETLAELHDEPALSGDDENSPRVQALVRLGKPSLEVILLRADGARRTIAWPVSEGFHDPVPLDRLPDAEQIEVVLDQAIRLPGWSDALTEAAQERAVTPEAWRDSAWLSSGRILLLPADGSPLRLGGQRLTYCSRDGLTVS
ncbi:CRISPR-associated helicase Cas3' [Streptomyces sp. NPDC018019]|uniref:CRISPR-associated helicase Cas3' n=1 Tax=Streptomyces sp. NPDC018019 TaxID=3365030 RepID=UPI0037A6CCAA